MNLDDLMLLEAGQHDFPLCPRPFAVLGERLGRSEAWVLWRLRELRRSGCLSRVGPVFAPNRAGRSLLAALRVPEARLGDVAQRVSDLPECNHNYQREHEWNLWFVLSGPDRGHLNACLDRLEAATGLHALRLPLVREYRIDLAFPLIGNRVAVPRPFPRTSPPVALEPSQRSLVHALQDGLELLAQPWLPVARRLGWSESQVVDAVTRLYVGGVIRRFGVVVRHHELGFRSNAMLVWDVDDSEVDAVGRGLAEEPGVNLCYRRARQAPEWRYNLFAMLHGRRRLDVELRIRELRDLPALRERPGEVLFSLTRFKQRGARFEGLREGIACA